MSLGWSVVDVFFLLLRGRAPTLAGWSGAISGHVLSVVAVALLIACLAAGVELLRSRLGSSSRRARALWYAGAFFLLAAPGAWVAASNLTSGEWIAQQRFASILRFALAFGLASSAAALAGHVAWTRGERFWPLVWSAGALVLAWANGRFLVGLYPDVHLVLYVASAALGLLGSAALLARWRPIGSLPVAGLAAGAVALGAASVYGLDARTRGLALETSPPLAQIFVLLTPPANRDILLRAIETDAPPPAPPPARVSLGNKPKNVILLVVDTLRGDALPPLRREGGHFEPGDTPFLDKWLERAYRFKNAYSQASRTNRSMPSSFQSREAFEDSLKVGIPLATRARSAGLVPLAVVPEWFLHPSAADARALLEGFERVGSFATKRQDRFLKEVRSVLAQAGKTPFFLWLHYFGMHEPYFGGKRPLPRGATAAQRYRAALQQLSEQLEGLVAELDKRKLTKNTLVVLMADHGEFLGERGFEKHGVGIHEEEIHVPLAFWVPGGGAGEVEALVGNIDVVPTIFDLLGSRNEAGLRGRSFVPEMRDLEKKSDRALYVVSGNGNRYGLITQEHRLVFDKPSGAFSLFARDDAAQSDDWFGRDPLLDRRLLGEFVRRNPALFFDELRRQETLTRLERALDESVGQPASERLGFLIDLALASERPDLSEQVRAVYERAPDWDTRLFVFQRAYAEEPERWAPRANELLRQHRGQPEEVALVELLGRLKFQEVERPLAVERLGELASDCESSRARAWLALVSSARLPDAYAAPLGAFLDCALLRDATGDAGVLPQVLDVLGVLSTQPRPELEAKVLPLLEHDSELVMVSAARALGGVGGDPTRAELDRRLTRLTSGKRPPDARFLGALLFSFARVSGPETIPRLIKLTESSLLLFPVIRALTEIGVGDPEARDFLERLSQEHKNPAMRRAAEHALRVVEKK